MSKNQGVAFQGPGYGFDARVESDRADDGDRVCGVPGCKNQKCASHVIPMNYFGVMFDTDVCDDCLPLVTLKAGNKAA